MSTTDSAPTRPTDTTSRKRGVGFPTVPLRDAAMTLSEAGHYGADFSLSAFASYLGLSTTNSGQFRQKLAAFRDWKLISTSGDRVVLSDLGKRIALSSDPVSERDALQEAFFGCRLFAEVYDDQAKGKPLDAQNLGKNAVIRWGVSASSRDQFAKSFIESAEVAGLARSESDHVVLMPRSSEAATDPSAAATEPLRNVEGSSTLSRTASSAAPVVLRQSWPTLNGELAFEIRSRAPLPAAAFAGVSTVAAAIEALARELNPSPPPEVAQ
jgi:hypothetical protein